MVHTGLLHSLDLDNSERTLTSLDDQNMQVYDTLSELCTQLEAGVTAHTTILYPRLISVLSHLPKEMLVQLYHEVSARRICPQHQRLRSVSLVVHCPSLSSQFKASSIFQLLSKIYFNLDMASLA